MASHTHGHNDTTCRACDQESVIEATRDGALDAVNGRPDQHGPQYFSSVAEDDAYCDAFDATLEAEAFQAEADRIQHREENYAEKKMNEHFNW